MAGPIYIWLRWTTKEIVKTPIFFSCLNLKSCNIWERLWLTNGENAELALFSGCDYPITSCFRKCEVEEYTQYISEGLKGKQKLSINEIKSFRTDLVSMTNTFGWGYIVQIICKCMCWLSMCKCVFIINYIKICMEYNYVWQTKIGIKLYFFFFVIIIIKEKENKKKEKQKWK